MYFRSVYVLAVILTQVGVACGVQLIPYGGSEGDTDTLVREDYGYEVDLGPDSFQFFGQSTSSIYITDNGAITFSTSFNGGGPNAYVDSKMWISPFGDDVLGGKGNIYFRKISTGTSLDTITSYVKDVLPSQSSFSASWALCSTWVAVEPFPGFGYTGANTFQSIIVTDGTLSFVLFLYKTLEWGKGMVGVSAGDVPNTYTICESRTETTKALPSKRQQSCGTDGLFGFRVDTVGLKPAGYLCTDPVSAGTCTIVSDIKAKKQLRCKAPGS